MARVATLLVVLLAAGACDGEGGEGKEPTAAPSAPSSDGAPSWRRLAFADVDRRELSARLTEGAKSADPARRALAVLGIARLRVPGATRLLEAALRDPDPAVRSHASLGLGALGDDGSAPALLGAVAAEEDARVRRDMLHDLARLGRPETLPALRHALEGPVPADRQAACRALAAFGATGRVASPDLMRRVAARLLEDRAPGVRAACAHALAELPRPVAHPEAARAVASDLRSALRDEEAEVRLQALRALARYPESDPRPLARVTADPDYRVAIHAFRTLARVLAGEPDALFASALRDRVDRSLAPDTALEGPDLHVLRAALDAAAPFATAPSTHGVAMETMERLASREDPTPDEGRAHCAAAELVDRGRQWPKAVLTCGLGRLNETRRREAAARVVGAADGSVEGRAGWLARLYKKGPNRVRQAVLRAAPAVGAPQVNGLVLQGLRSGDRGLAAAAAQAVTRLAPRWLAEGARAREEEVAPGVEPLAPPYAHELRAAMVAAHRLLADEDYAAGLLAWLEAVTALRAADFAGQVRALTLHANVAVRRAAQDAAAALGEPRGKGAAPPPRHPLAAPDFLPPGAWTATIQTSRGEVVVELWEELAPGTVARFVQLARQGFYDGVPFHHVAPGFVVQGGDPRGDGHGGPDFRVRSEDHRRAFEAGTFGLANAGRDTGGSQFFVTLGPAPQLWGRYTAFGRVRRGMDAVVRLQEGDRIRSVSVSRETNP